MKMNNLSFSVKKTFTIIIVSLFGGLTITAVFLGESPDTARIGRLYLERGFEFENITNTVFGVYGIFRFYDTLLELMIFSTAVLGITIFSDLEPSTRTRGKQMIESHVVTASASFLYPIMAVFGLYLAFSAHLGPGGGFAAGVIGGSGILFLALSKGAEEMGRRFNEHTMKRVEYIALVFAMLVMVLGILFPKLIFEDLQGIGTIIAVNMAIGLKVFIGTWAILHFFVKHRGEV